MTRYIDLVPPVTPPPRNYDNNHERELIARDVEKYLARGGKIQKLPDGATAYKGLTECGE